MNRKHTTVKPTGMTPEEIIRAIEDAGLNQAAIARVCEKKPQAVWSVIHGKSVSITIHKAIAKAINKDIQQIWPQHYLNRTPKPGPKKIIWDIEAAQIQ